MEDTLRVKLKAFRDDGGYIKYVFQDLDKEAHFILCTKFPNLIDLLEQFLVLNTNKPLTLVWKLAQLPIAL